VDVRLEKRDKLRKFMSALPNEWTYYCMAIKRTENLNCMTFPEMYGILSGYQMEMDARAAPAGRTSNSGSSALHSGSGQIMKYSQEY
jgi:hypothetical protein